MFTSDVHLCLTVGGTVVRRGKRPLRRHLGEITMPSRRRSCLRTDLEAVDRTPDYISSGQGGFKFSYYVNFTMGADLTISVR